MAAPAGTNFLGGRLATGDAHGYCLKLGARPASFFSGHHFLFPLPSALNSIDATEGETHNRAASCKAHQQFHRCSPFNQEHHPQGSADTAVAIVSNAFNAARKRAMVIMSAV